MSEGEVDFHALLAHLAEDIELLRVSIVRVVVDVLKLHYHPPLQALPVHVSCPSRTSARCHMRVLVVLLDEAAEAAVDGEQYSSVVEVLLVDEAPVSHQTK